MKRILFKSLIRNNADPLRALPNYLATLGLATIALQLWIILEAVAAWPRARGVLEDLSGSTESLPEGGRSC